MPTVYVRGQPVDVDVRAELAQYEWTNARWTDTKLIAASPFRYDRHPSFFVRLEPDGNGPAGVWADSGAYDSEWASGNFIKLLAFLRHETEEETADYLLATYGGLSTEDDGERLELRLPTLKLREEKCRQPLPESMLEPYRYRHPYLGRRGISEAVQRLMGVGYDRKNKAVTIPWRAPDGSLANVMYRSVRGKAFWYVKGGWPLRSLVYGLDIVYQRGIKRAVLCEAPIDAMTAMSAGHMGLALGRARISDEQAEAIAKSPLEEIVIATDNDAAGERCKREAIEKLAGRVRLRAVEWPEGCKDLNELHAEFCASLNVSNIVESAPRVETVKALWLS